MIQSIVAHFVQAIRYKLWWLLPTAVLAASGETLGWSARYWSSLNDGILQTPYTIQYVCCLHCRLYALPNRVFPETLEYCQRSLRQRHCLRRISSLSDD